MTSIFSRAFANWAATAYISGIVVVVAIMVRGGAWKWLAASLAIGIVRAGRVPGRRRARDPARRTAHRRRVPPHARLARAWASRRAGWRARSGARAIVGDKRDDVASLLYYWRDQPEAGFRLAAGARPDASFRADPGAAGNPPLPLLFVSRCPRPGISPPSSPTVEPLGGPLWRARARHPRRTYHAFKLDSPRGPIGPLGHADDAHIPRLPWSVR